MKYKNWSAILYNARGFPQCTGANDSYINRKGFSSINVQTTYACDYEYKFIDRVVVK